MGLIAVHIINVHITILQLVIRAQKEIAEEHLQELCGGVNALLQIRIVCSDQGVAEVPRVLFKGVVVHTKAEGFHIFDHKHGGGTGVSLAEGMDLPNVGGEFRQMLHRCIYGQALIGELFFSGKIVIQRILDTVPIRIDHGVAVQHPLFLGDVVLPNLTRVFEYTLKQSAVDGEPLGRRELEGFFPQQLCNSGRDNVRLFGFIFYFGAGGALLIIAMNALLGFINGDFALNVVFGRIQQIGTPEDIYNEPKNAFVADFIGESNILNGVMVRDKVVKMYGREFPCVDGGFAPNEPVDVVIRPEDIDIVPVEQGQLVGTVTSVTFKGMQYDIIVDFRGFKWLIQTTDHSPEGARIGVKIDPDGFHIMKKSEYSGQFGDYSSYSEEYEELADASLETDEEESGDEE